jgi:hypothetical protein
MGGKGVGELNFCVLLLQHLFQLLLPCERVAFLWCLFCISDTQRLKVYRSCTVGVFAYCILERKTNHPTEGNSVYCTIEGSGIRRHV